MGQDRVNETRSGPHVEKTRQSIKVLATTASYLSDGNSVSHAANTRVQKEV